MKRSAAKSVSVVMGCIFVLGLWGAPAALAQCAMCKAAVAASGDSAAATLDKAILVLLIPPVMIFCAIFIVAYRLRAGAQGDEARETPNGEWVSHAWLDKPDAGASRQDAHDGFKQGWTG
jgi:hypothetical protein